jgi:hypothetical protein
MSGPVASLKSSIGPGETVVPWAGDSTENGPERLTSRDVGENSNARVVRTPIGSGIVAAIDRWTAETFSTVEIIAILKSEHRPQIGAHLDRRQRRV